MRLATSQETRRIAFEHIMPWVFVPIVIVSFYTAVVLDRTPAIDVSTLQGRAVPPIVREAGSLTIQWQAERRHDCPTVISHEVVDSANGVHRIDRVPGPKSFNVGFDEWSSTVKVPPAAAWGKARYRSSIQYECGLTRWIVPVVIESPEVPFEIVPLTQKKIEELRG